MDSDLALCSVINGRLRVGGYEYKILLTEDGVNINPDSQRLLDEFAASGGLLHACGDCLDFIRANGSVVESMNPSSKYLRIIRITKNEIDFYMLFNECDSGESDIKGVFTTEIIGKVCELDLFTGGQKPLPCVMKNGKLCVDVFIKPYRCLVITIDGSREFEAHVEPAYRITETVRLGELDVSVYGSAEPVHSETEFTLRGFDRCTIAFDRVMDVCGIEIDGNECEDIISKPFEADVTSLMDPSSEKHTVRLTAYPSSANRFGNPVDCGVSGARIIAEERIDKVSTEC